MYIKTIFTRSIIIVSQEVLSKRLELCSGPLSELEIRLLTDNSLKISLQSSSSFRLHLNQKMKMFERISYPDPGSVSQHSVDDLYWTFSEVREKLMTKKTETGLTTSDSEFRMIQLKKKLSEVKINGKVRVEDPKRNAKSSDDSERRSKIKEQLQKWKEKQAGQQSSPRPSSVLSNAGTQSLHADVRSGDNLMSPPANNEEDCINTGQEAASSARVNELSGNENLNSSQDKEAVQDAKTASQDLMETEEEVGSQSGEDIVKTVKRTLQVSQRVSVSSEVKSKQDSRLISSPHSSLFYQSNGSRSLRLCSRLSDQRFGDGMMAFLSSHGVTSSTSIQSVMWPALARLSSLVAVAGPGSGKTFGWSLPLLAALADRRQYRYGLGQS